MRFDGKALLASNGLYIGEYWESANATIEINGRASPLVFWFVTSLPSGYATSTQAAETLMIEVAKGKGYK